MPIKWNFYGSNDDTNWTLLNSQSAVSWGSTQTKTFNITNIDKYIYYRFLFYRNNLAGGRDIVVGDCSLYAQDFV